MCEEVVMKMSESGSKTRVDRKSDSDAVEVTCSRFTRIVGFPRSLVLN